MCDVGKSKKIFMFVCMLRKGKVNDKLMFVVWCGILIFIIRRKKKEKEKERQQGLLDVFIFLCDVVCNGTRVVLKFTQITCGRIEIMFSHIQNHTHLQIPLIHAIVCITATDLIEDLHPSKAKSITIPPGILKSHISSPGIPYSIVCMSWAEKN